MCVFRCVQNVYDKILFDELALKIRIRATKEQENVLLFLCIHETYSYFRYIVGMFHFCCCFMRFSGGSFGPTCFSCLSISIKGFICKIIIKMSLYQKLHIFQRWQNSGNSKSEQESLSRNTKDQRRSENSKVQHITYNI